MSETLGQSYAAFHAPLEFGERPALVVVDFVQAYLEPESPLYAGVEDARLHAVSLLEAARAAGVPILHTNVVFEPGGVDGGVFYRKLPILRVFDRGSPLGAFAAGLEPRPGEPVVRKQYASAFFGTSLAPTLTALGVDTLIVCGLTTSGCVRATVVDACQHGFLPFVVREACGDRHEAPHEANLFDLSAKYAEVIGLEAARAFLAGEHPTR